MNADSESIFMLPMHASFASSSAVFPFLLCKTCRDRLNEFVLPLRNGSMVQRGFSRRMGDLLMKPVSQ